MMYLPKLLSLRRNTFCLLTGMPGPVVERQVQMRWYIGDIKLRAATNFIALSAP